MKSAPQAGGVPGRRHKPRPPGESALASARPLAWQPLCSLQVKVCRVHTRWSWQDPARASKLSAHTCNQCANSCFPALDWQGLSHDSSSSPTSQVRVSHFAFRQYRPEIEGSI